MLLSILLALTIAEPVPKTLDPSAIAKIVAALSDNDPDVRQNLATALVRIGPATIPVLTEALKDSDADRRAGAAYALGLHGEAAAAALPVLLDLLKDYSADVRRQASYAVSRVIVVPAREGR